MNPDLKTDLGDYLLGIADDELILGHRNSEWCGHAPIIEEDIAFANIALDEIGHATLWYKLVAELRGEDEETYPDRLVFRRESEQFRNIQMVELPKGDWAFSILRQYLFDTMELIRLTAMLESEYQPLSEAAAKIRQEETYHHRHTSMWIKRLAMGTEESHRRTQNALNVIWPYAFQMFQPEDINILHQEERITPVLMKIYTEWTAEVQSQLLSCSLTIPQDMKLSLKRDQHSPHLLPLVTEMQSVVRLNPQANW